MALASWMWLGGACVALGLLSVIVWGLLRISGRAQRGTRLEPDWQSRAEALERRANEAEALVRSGLFPIVARLLHSKFVLGLLHQRSTLVQAHVQSADKVTELEQRLAEAQSKVQDRLGEYEQQLAALRQQQEALPGATPPLAASGPAASPTPPRGTGTIRRNPLIPPSPSVEPAAVNFSDIMARKRSAAPGSKEGPAGAKSRSQ